MLHQHQIKKLAKQYNVSINSTIEEHDNFTVISTPIVKTPYVYHKPLHYTPVNNTTESTRTGRSVKRIKKYDIYNSHDYKLPKSLQKCADILTLLKKEIIAIYFMKL